MTPVDRQHVDRVLAVVEALKDTAKSLETLHEIDASRAVSFVDKSPPLAPAASASDDSSAPKRLGLTFQLFGR